MLSKRHMSTSARETVELWNDRTYITGPAPIFIYRATLPGRLRTLAPLLTINKIRRFFLAPAFTLCYSCFDIQNIHGQTLPRLCGEISMLDRRRSGGNPACHLRRTILDII